MQFSPEHIAEKIAPVARNFDLRNVWVFGSQARGEATSKSDVDLLVDRGSYRTSLLAPTGLINMKQQFESALGAPVDLVTLDAVQENVVDDQFEEVLDREKVLVYEQR